MFLKLQLVILQSFDVFSQLGTERKQVLDKVIEQHNLSKIENLIKLFKTKVGTRNNINMTSPNINLSELKRVSCAVEVSRTTLFQLNSIA